MESKQSLADLTPDDFYDEYNEYLLSYRADLHICNGDDLIRHFEAGTRFEEFLKERNRERS